MGIKDLYQISYAYVSTYLFEEIDQSVLTNLLFFNYKIV